MSELYVAILSEDLITNISGTAVRVSLVFQITSLKKSQEYTCGRQEGQCLPQDEGEGNGRRLPRSYVLKFYVS